jgi:phosphopantothenoylcysteine decarboxylase
MKVLLGVTGSVAAIRTPELYQSLREAGYEVKIVATQASLYFFDPAGIGQSSKGTRTSEDADRNREIVILDEDEWPGRDRGVHYQRDDPILHIELRRWADLLLIAPIDANTLAKLAAGLADNCLTCVWRAWDPARPVILAPAMNTLMWEHPLTIRHLYQLAHDSSRAAPPDHVDVEVLLDWINRNCPKLHIVPPVSKRLACGDVGVGAMADVEEIVKAVSKLTRNSS